MATRPRPMLAKAFDPGVTPFAPAHTAAQPPAARETLRHRRICQITAQCR
jgi:hypothetical protein